MVFRGGSGTFFTVNYYQGCGWCREGPRGVYVMGLVFHPYVYGKAPPITVDPHFYTVIPESNHGAPAGLPVAVPRHSAQAR